MAAKVVDVFVLEVEEVGDYVFEIAGIVFLYSNQKFQLISASGANHNRFRAAINRFTFEQLQEGVTWKNAEFRLKPFEEDVKQEGWENPDGVPVLLQRMYNQNPRQLFFLKKHINSL